MFQLKNLERGSWFQSLTNGVKGLLVEHGTTLATIIMFDHDGGFEAVRQVANTISVKFVGMDAYDVWKRP